MQLLTKRYIVFRGITIGCLQLSTISCRHKKSGNPVKSRLPLQIKEARDGARGPGDLGLRGPERSVDIELSSPGRARKKERYRFGIVLFSSARRGSNPQSISKGNVENTGNADKYCGCGNIRNTLCAIKIYYLHAFYNTMQHECTMKCNMIGYVAMLCSSINFTKSF